MRVAIAAYACDPAQGSEPGAGWVACLAARAAGHEVTVFTRAGGAPELEVRADEHQIAVVRLGTRLKRGVSPYAPYLEWLIRASRAIRTRDGDYDVVHHVTYASDSIPGVTHLPLGKLPRRVWGPVGGATLPPLGLLRYLSARARLEEVVRGLATSVMRAVTVALCKAFDVAVLALNEDSASALRRTRVIGVHPNIVLESTALQPPQERRRNQWVYASRALEWKGLLIAVRAVALAGDGHHLVVVGDGPGLERARTLAEQIEAPVTFKGRIDHAACLHLIEESALLILPSLHDSAPWVAAEAAASGTPVVCLDLGGVAMMADSCAVVVSARPTSNVVARLSRAATGAARTRPEPTTPWTLGSLASAFGAAYDKVT